MKSDALKDRIKIIAKQKGVSFNEVWKQLLLERLLARLSQSNHQKKFIFKGGLLLSQYLVIGRETTAACKVIIETYNNPRILPKRVTAQ